METYPKTLLAVKAAQGTDWVGEYLQIVDISVFGLNNCPFFL